MLHLSGSGAHMLASPQPQTYSRFSMAFSERETFPGSSFHGGEICSYGLFPSLPGQSCIIFTNKACIKPLLAGKA